MSSPVSLGDQIVTLSTPVPFTKIRTVHPSATISAIEPIEIAPVSDSDVVNKHKRKKVL